MSGATKDNRHYNQWYGSNYMTNPWHWCLILLLMHFKHLRSFS